MICGLLAMGAGAAHADDIAAAKMHYERGTTLFDLQRYDEAAKEYEAAFEAKNDAALLFNIGQAYRFAGNHTKAIAAYRSYLRRLPDAPNRAEVELRISELQKLVDEQKRTQQAPPSGTLKPGETKPSQPEPTSAAAPSPPVAPASAPSDIAEPNGKSARVKLIAGIAVAAVGVAAVAVGGAFEGLAKSQNDALSHPTPGTTFDPSKERALKTDKVIGAVMLSVGGAAIVAGTVTAVLGLRERKRTQRAMLTPVIGTHHWGVVFDAPF